MDDISQRLPRTLWVGVVLFLALLCLAYMLSVSELNTPHRHTLPVLGRITDFTLTNQDGATTKLANLSNHVWVADIIFTRCAGPCPTMTTQMKSLQDALPTASPARLVTLTTDPDFDTPPVMKKYGERYGANFSYWKFLTGTKAEIAGLAGDSLKLSAVPVKPEDRKNDADLFIHTTIFVVVDKHARLRAVFETEGEGIDWANVKPRILLTVWQLEHER
jgi:protein SCO1/2